MAKYGFLYLKLAAATYQLVVLSYRSICPKVEDKIFLIFLLSSKKCRQSLSVRHSSDSNASKHVANELAVENPKLRRPMSGYS